MIAALVLASALAIPPAPADYVTDNAHALRPSAAASIRQELRAYHDATGNRVIVYIDQTTGDTPLEDWTVSASHAWKIGSKGKDNGAILFAFMRDRKVRIEVGYGLESSLTDADSSRIIRDTIVPRMREGDVDGAIEGGVNGMLHAITPSFQPAAGAVSSAAKTTNGSELWLWLLFLFFFIVVPWMVMRLSNWMDSAPGAAYAGSGAAGGSSSVSSSSSDDESSSSDSDDDDFSGGGDFGGGGASGSW